MIVNIKACSFDEALDILLDEHPEIEILNLIKRPTNDLDDATYEGLGLDFYYMSRKPGENVNQTQTKVNNMASEGAKKWETRYLVVDMFDNILVPTSEELKFKADAVTKAREWTNENYTPSFVILGKSLVGASRTQARIDYKPSMSQDEGLWVFIY